MFASRHTCPPLLPHSLFHPVSTQFRVQYIFLLVLPRIPTTKVLVSAQRSVWRENVRRTEGKNASEISEEWFFNRGPRGTVEEKEEEDPPAPVRGSQEIRQRGSGGRSVAFTLVAPWWFTARPVWFSQRGIWRRINGIMISCVTLRMRARPINQAALWGAGREGGLLSPLAPSSLYLSLSFSRFGRLLDPLERLASHERRPKGPIRRTSQTGINENQRARFHRLETSSPSAHASSASLPLSSYEFTGENFFENSCLLE